MKGDFFMKKKKFKFPDFDKMTYEEEAKCWDTHSFADFWDELEDVDIVFDLKKPRDETLIVRLQKELKDRLERIARNRGLNISTLARMWLIEKLRQTQSK